MKHMIKAALFTPTYKGWGLPLIFWGEPGVAKSDLVESVCAEYELPCEVLSPGERGEGAFGVVPVPKKTGSEMFLHYPMPEYVLNFEAADGRGVVFIDELNTAQGSVRAALLGLIQSKRLGGGHLGDKVRILAASNPPEDAADGSDLPAATANRLGHIQWEAPTVSQWADWLTTVPALPDTVETVSIEKRSLADAEEARVLEAWSNPFAINKGHVAGFLHARATQLHNKPKEGDPALGRAWPSRRTWYLATVALTSVQVHGLDDGDAIKLLAGFVGFGAAKEFTQWRAAADLPNALDLLDGQVTFEYNPRRLDIMRAVLSSCASLCADPKLPKREARVQAMWSLLQEAIDANAQDIAVGIARTLIRATPFNSGARLSNGKAASKILAQIGPAMQEAGML